ncbi:hypothetical protein OE497_31760, partial [Pseudomonas aeruginosa]|nr:hypothetical protein [Pseudomonas aeruginosa]
MGTPLAHIGSELDLGFLGYWLGFEGSDAGAMGNLHCAMSKASDIPGSWASHNLCWLWGPAGIKGQHA